MEPPFKTENYLTATSLWPVKGRHILSAEDKDGNIIVYQAYKASIGKWATQNQTFVGCPEYSMTRMTWIKPNFLWMMYRSGWARKPSQDTILALTVRKEGFEQILRLTKLREEDAAVGSSQVEASTLRSFGKDDVRIQWDPDHDPYGGKVDRRALQLGLRGAAMEAFLKEWIVSIHDITEFVTSQYQSILAKNLEQLLVPVERVYEISDKELRNHIQLDDYDVGDKK